jgi:hypothetical protein
MDGIELKPGDRIMVVGNDRKRRWWQFWKPRLDGIYEVK